MKSLTRNSSEDDGSGSFSFRNARLSRPTLCGLSSLCNFSPPNSIIRKVNRDDLDEINRIDIIDKSFGVLKYMTGKTLEGKELLAFITDTSERSLYVISGSPYFVSKKEVGKLQGWIMVYSGKEVTARAVRAFGKKVLECSLPILEVSYAKYPHAASGQMANGVRQVLLEIARRDGSYQRLVTAYIEPENIKSQHVVEASGFILQKRRILWDIAESKKKDLVYLLSWEKLYRLSLLLKIHADF